MTLKSGTKLHQQTMNEQNLTELQKKIDAGVKMAIAEAIEKHRRLGQSISIWQDGKVVTLTADQIPPLDGENKPTEKN
jgi:hypothetical protein